MDIDKGWNPEEGTLQQHREAVLKEADQPGFGADSKKAKARATPTAKAPRKAAPAKPTDDD